MRGKSRASSAPHTRTEPSLHFTEPGSTHTHTHTHTHKRARACLETLELKPDHVFILPIQSCSLLYFWSTFIIINVNKTSSTIFWCARKIGDRKKPKTGLQSAFRESFDSAPKTRFESNDSRNALWIPVLNQMTRVWSPVLNQMTRETRFESPFWTKWLAKRALKPHSDLNDSRNAIWSPVLNQMTRETRFEALLWTKWLAKRVWIPVLNQITRENALWRAPFWTKWLAKRALNPRSEPNDSRNALWRAPFWIN